jgi:DNA polymerase-1
VKTALLDGDTLIYEATSASEYVAQLDTWQWTLTADLSEGIDKLTAKVNAIQKAVKADELIFALSDDERWRPRVMPTYKSQRLGSRKPITYLPMREYVHKTFRTYQRPTLEGDDVLGILTTHPTLVKGEKVVVAIDKDMKQIPGVLFNYSTGKFDEVWAFDADYFHLFQTLTGDVTDGYKGCPGIGDKKAEVILAPHKGGDFFDGAGAWKAVVAAFEKAGLTEADALQNAQVARICRHTDYDFKKKEVILWQPK